MVTTPSVRLMRQMIRLKYPRTILRRLRVRPVVRLDRSAVAVAAAPVPEPQTWAMMILGFGAVGYLIRRRRARSHVHA